MLTDTLPGLRDVGCPECGALAYEPCRALPGELSRYGFLISLYGYFKVHRERVEAIDHRMGVPEEGRQRKASMNINEEEARLIIELVHMAEFPVDGADDLYSRIQREFPAIGEEHRLHREFSDLNVQTLRDAREVPRVAEAFMRLSSAKEATMSKGKHVTEAEKAEEEAANRAYQDALNEERTKLIKERGLESFGQWSMRQTWSLKPREDEMQEATEWEVVKRVEAIIKGMDFPEGMRIDVGRARYEGGEVEGIGFRVVIDGKPGRSRVYAADDIQDMSDRDIRELVAGLLREESLARLIKTFRSHERVNWILMGVFVFWVVFWVVLLASRLP